MVTVAPKDYVAAQWGDQLDWFSNIWQHVRTTASRFDLFPDLGMFCTSCNIIILSASCKILCFFVLRVSEEVSLRLGLPHLSVSCFMLHAVQADPALSACRSQTNLCTCAGLSNSKLDAGPSMRSDSHRVVKLLSGAQPQLAIVELFFVLYCLSL